NQQRNRLLVADFLPGFRSRLRNRPFRLKRSLAWGIRTRDLRFLPGQHHYCLCTTIGMTFLVTLLQVPLRVEPSSTPVQSGFKTVSWTGKLFSSTVWPWQAVRD